MLSLLLSSVLVIGAAQSAPGGAPAKRIEGLTGLTNVALVAPGIYRGGTPTPGGVTSLSRLGVKTIVNLRHFHGRSEADAAARSGLRYVWLPIASSGEPSPETLSRFLALVQDPAAQPVYVHCYRGKDRTGAMIAAYRILVDHWSARDAVAEMQEFGFFGGWVRLRRWVERLDDGSSHGVR